MQLWNIHAVSLPSVPRHCPRCDARRAFVSSGKFRVNAHKRRLDVWLVHRCAACEETWNATILERTPPEAIGPDLRRFEENDAGAAWRHAFAVPGADRAVPWRVARSGDGDVATLRLVDPVQVRLDALLARELALPRRALAHLRGRVADGQIVYIASHR